MWKQILISISIWLLCTSVTSCYLTDDVAGANTDGDSDTDGDTDTDSDGDTDTDSDGDTDTDVDTDTDGDADLDCDADSDSDDDDGCCSFEIPINGTPINMLFLLDRSRSMVLNTFNNETFADMTANAIIDAVEHFDSRDLVNFGLTAFPSHSCYCNEWPGDEYCNDDPFIEEGCTPSQTTGDPLVDSPLVAISNETTSSIAMSLSTVGTCGETPVAGTLVWSLDYLNALPSNMAQYKTIVVIITDGAPNCNHTGELPITAENCICTLPEGQECMHRYQCLDDAEAYNATTQLHNADYQTYVISLGEIAAMWEDVMNGIADSGGTEDQYPTTNQEEIQDALWDIISGSIPCTFTVNWDEVPDGSPPIIKACDHVMLSAFPDLYAPNEQAQLPYSGDCSNPTAWRWQELPGVPFDDLFNYTIDQCQTIELCEEACDDLQNGTYDGYVATFG